MKFLIIACMLSSGLIFNARADLTIVQKLETPDGDKLTGDITILAKDSQTRVDMGSEMSTISDDKKNKVITLVHSQKMAMEMPEGAMQEMKSKVEAANAEALSPDDFKPTGKKQTINGFDCAEFTYRVNGQTVTSWFAQSLKNDPKIVSAFEELSKSTNPMASSLTQFEAMPGIPIRTQFEIPGSGTTTLTVEKISTDPIPDSAFQIPSGYQSIQMPSIPITR